jgi:hypothetical protein
MAIVLHREHRHSLTIATALAKECTTRLTAIAVLMDGKCGSQ